MSAAPPPRWSDEELDADLNTAASVFRQERLHEPVEQYREAFDDYVTRIRTLLDRTDCLSRLASVSQGASDQEPSPEDLQNMAAAVDELLGEDPGLEALRYLTGPPISADDLKTLAEASLAPSRLRDDPEAAARIFGVVLASLDAKRFPWVAEQRRPDRAELRAATLASASLMATQRVQTNRKSLARTAQETHVADYLAGAGFTAVGPREIRTSDDAPGRGPFCRECMFGDRKADLVVRLNDGRIMPIECKVSNSATNSVKRLNNDAAVKADAWIKAVRNAPDRAHCRPVGRVQEAQPRSGTGCGADDFLGTRPGCPRRVHSLRQVGPSKTDCRERPCMRHDEDSLADRGIPRPPRLPNEVDTAWAVLPVYPPIVWRYDRAILPGAYCARPRESIPSPRRLRGPTLHYERIVDWTYMLA